VRGSFVVPTLNEAGSIGHVLRTFRAATDAANQTRFVARPIEWELLVVDGASADGTADLARAAGARVVVETRKGYGRAYRTGFAEATGEIIATADGDATYPVERIPELVDKLLTENLDFITCNRLAYLDRRAMTTEHRIGNRILNLVVHIAYHHYLQGMRGTKLLDSQSGMWIFRGAILPRLHLTQDGMPMSEELKLEALLRGFQLEEVPIPYAERWGAPKLSSWRDGQKNLTFLLEKRLAVARESRQSPAMSLNKRGSPGMR
jgi:dolichol-phosphate hexosyltransferase